MISFRSFAGISDSETYKDMIRKARSSKLRSRHSDSQLAGRAGMCSGMNRPPSAANPLRTTSSKDSYIREQEELAVGPRKKGRSEGTVETYTVGGTPRTKISLRKNMRHGGKWLNGQ